ncbi:hypothetical protein TWF173_006774 [Orbilia oligospora]|nr:hypothetical protein TWF173_006774 [Orbilia oligospora]
MQFRFERIAKRYSNDRAAVATASRWVLTELNSTKPCPEWWRMLSLVLIARAATCPETTFDTDYPSKCQTSGLLQKTSLPYRYRRAGPLEAVSSPDSSTMP